MQDFANGIISMTNGQKNDVISVFSGAVLLIAFINIELVAILEKKYNKTFIPEVIIAKGKVVGCIISMLVCIALVWLPFDWAKVASRIIFICFLLFPILPFVFNKDYYWHPCILITVAGTFYWLTNSGGGMINPFWNKFFVLSNIIILFLFVLYYCFVLARSFIGNLRILYLKDRKPSTLSEKSDSCLFYVSKIGLIASVALSYVVVVYSDEYFSDSFEKAFCFIAEAIIIPYAITLLLEIKNKKNVSNKDQVGNR